MDAKVYLRLGFKLWIIVPYQFYQWGFFKYKTVFPLKGIDKQIVDVT